MPALPWWMCGARAVYSGLHTLRAQALRVRTCAQDHQADVLAKYANTISLKNTSLFGVGLNAVVVKAASAAQDYLAMEDGFMLAGMHYPKPL